MCSSRKSIIGILMGGFFALALISPAMAYNIEAIEVDLSAKDFLVGPVKTELTIDPGKQVGTNLTITNRFEKDRDFTLEIEDFSGTKDMSELVHFWGQNKGPFSLRDFLKPELTNFSLKSGQRITMPVVITIPEGTEPGGLFGAVVVTSEPTITDKALEEQNSQGNVSLISRVASLYFIRVSGPAKEDGQLMTFSANGKFFTDPKISFRTVFENNGNVSLNPSGKIEIKNIIGSKVGEIPIEPYFVLPNAARAVDYNYDGVFMLGYYTANLSLNAGYGDKIENKVVSFWVLPYKILILIVLILLAVIFLIQGVRKWLKANFQRRK